jgi:AcrR family transcriptional regulator
MPNRDRRAERREATRREILDLAWELAHRDGIAQLTLREVAMRMGMRPPSLYSHFDSKNAIYDAMFAESWQQVLDGFVALEHPEDPRRSLRLAFEYWFDFSTADLARYQLMNRSVIPGFAPSEDAYAPSLAAYEWMRAKMRAIGVRTQADLDLWTALTTGLIDQQLANDPGGTRWRRQIPRLVDMYADEVGIPGPRLRRKR